MLLGRSLNESWSDGCCKVLLLSNDKGMEQRRSQLTMRADQINAWKDVCWAKMTRECLQDDDLITIQADQIDSLKNNCWAMMNECWWINRIVIMRQIRWSLEGWLLGDMTTENRWDDDLITMKAKSQITFLKNDGTSIRKMKARRGIYQVAN